MDGTTYDRRRRGGFGVTCSLRYNGRMSSSAAVTRASFRATGEPLLWGIRVLVLLLLLLHLAATTWPEAMAWGLWPWRYVSPPLRLLFSAGVAALCIPAIGRRVSRSLMLVTARAAPMWAGRRRIWVFLALALLVVPLLWMLRLVHSRWGDAYILINAIALSDPAQRLIYTWQAPLTVWWHARFWAWGQRLWGWRDAMPAYAVTSVIAGAAFVFSALNLAWTSGRTRGQRVLTISLLLTLGTMQLFFGYVENYTLAALAIVVTLWLAARFVQGVFPLWGVALVLALTHGLHPATLFLFPALWVLVFLDRQRHGTWHALWSVAGPYLVVGVGVLLVMTAGGHGLGALLTSDRPGGGDGRWLVPLVATTTRWEHYTLFSFAHLVDIVNEQLLTAPVSLGVLILVLLLDRPRRWLTDGLAGGAVAQDRWWLGFLAAATAGGLLFIWLWNPDYGGQRDWDLFSLTSLPLTVLAAWMVGRALPDEAARWEAALLLGAVCLLHTGAWVYQNTLPWSWPT